MEMLIDIVDSAKAASEHPMRPRDIETSPTQPSEHTHMAHGDVKPPIHRSRGAGMRAAVPRTSSKRMAIRH